VRNVAINVSRFPFCFCCISVFPVILNLSLIVLRGGPITDNAGIYVGVSVSVSRDTEGSLIIKFLNSSLNKKESLFAVTLFNLFSLNLIIF